MASLRDIRIRIRSVKSTQQITKAMKMVAAAKLRRAQEAIVAARPYASMLDQIITDLSSRSDGELAHPLLAARSGSGKAELLVMTSDRGLAGGFNSNAIRRAGRFLYENEKTYSQIRISTIGRKGHEYFRKRSATLRHNYEGIFKSVNYRTAANIATELSSAFLAGEVDSVFVVYNEFISAVTQQVKLVQLLPLQTAAQTPAGQARPTAVDFKYEPDRQAVLNKLVPQALAIKIYRALLDSVASEHGSRMSAMENASTNASDMIDRLTLFYNRTRQAAITKELMEIVSGSEALK